MAVLFGPGAAIQEKYARRADPTRSVVGTHLRNLANFGGMRCPGSGFRALHSPPGPHSPIGRGSGLKIRPVSVRVRLGARQKCCSSGILFRRDHPQHRSRPQTVRSSLSGGIEGVRNVVEIVREQMSVTVQGERGCLVAQRGLQHLHVGPCADCQGRTGVARLVRCDDRKFGRLGLASLV
jgi:hypothetical protein